MKRKLCTLPALVGFAMLLGVPAVYAGSANQAGSASGTPGTATTAPRSSLSPETEARLKSALEQHGYSDVQVTDVAEDKITVQASKGGQVVMLEIDARGTVRERAG